MRERFALVVYSLRLFLSVRPQNVAAASPEPRRRSPSTTGGRPPSAQLVQPDVARGLLDLGALRPQQGVERLERGLDEGSRRASMKQKSPRSSSSSPGAPLPSACIGHTWCTVALSLTGRSVEGERAVRRVEQVGSVGSAAPSSTPRGSA